MAIRSLKRANRNVPCPRQRSGFGNGFDSHGDLLLQLDNQGTEMLDINMVYVSYSYSSKG